MKNNFPLRIAVSGITGRMGKSVIQCIIDQKKCDQKIELGAVITRIGSDICGIDVGSFIKSDDIGIIITDNLDIIKNDFDILIDFTYPDISIEYLKFCVNNNKNMVIGTTGFSKSHQSFIKNASRRIGIVHAANFSIGIALIIKLLNVITRVMGSISDIDIIEAHHNKKIDIPSGTALMMKDIIMDVLTSISVDTKLNYCAYTDVIHKLSSYNIPIHSIRAGDFVGEHSVLFTSIGESLKIIHTANNRIIFASGALRSAMWLGSDKIGLFDMCDVLGINKL